MRLSDKQSEFATAIAKLITWANKRQDMRVRLGWAYDPPGSNSGRGASSNHRARLAVDLILDVWDGSRWVYATDTESYRKLGEKWWSLDERCEWGGESRAGRWRGDGNHFSFKHNGRW